LVVVVVVLLQALFPLPMLLIHRLWPLHVLRQVVGEADVERLLVCTD
jgi:hypothetical protein